jgi:hypothetical protein
MKNKLTFSYLVKNIGIVIGLVFVWRGIWHILDEVDIYIFNDYKLLTALGYIAIGLLILYIPDKDLKEIEKL